MKNKKEISYFCQGFTGTLHYCILEHSGFDPYELVSTIVKDSGIIILSLDSSEIKGEDLDYIQKSLKEDGINATIQSGNLWIGKEDSSKYYNSEYSIIEGNEHIFTSNLPKSQIPKFGNPIKGWHGDKLKNKVVQILEQNLLDDDLYAYDDYLDCLFVSKNESIISLIAKNVEKFKNRS